ncbi:MAG TPA: DivIVA domain-containing protein [Jatrophihabitantaceae bacterium]|jgi:DivIVA domain-containing protein
MPLTPAEVHNVAFKKPPIGKRGYDEEEVDAFLDIVEVELARLIEENNDLRARPGGGGPPQANGGVGLAEVAAAREDNARLQARIAELEKALTQGKDGTAQQLAQVQQQLGQSEQQVSQLRQQLQQSQLAAQQAQQQAQAAQQQAASAAAAPGGVSDEHHSQAVQMLALAQQTADQHLAQSKSEAERLLAEAQANAHAALSNSQAQADKHMAEAKTRAEQMERESSTKAAQAVQDAEQRATTITAQLEQRKSALERRVEELRTFEREYRTRLKSYLESQLRDLDASSRPEPAVAQEGQRAAG